MNRTVALAAFGALDFETLGLSTLDRAVKAIKVETTWGPPIYIPSPFKRSAQDAAASGSATGPATSIPGKGFDVARLLRPKVTLEMASGWGKDLSFAPYGAPGPSRWGIVALGGVAILLLAVAGGVTLGKRVR